MSKIFYAGSAINSAFEKIDSFEKKKKNFQEKKINGTFVGEKEKETEQEEVEKAELKAAKAVKEINNKKIKAEEKGDKVVTQIISRIENERSKNIQPEIDPKETSSGKKKKPSWRTEKLSRLSGKEQKFLSKIFEIIKSSTNEETAELIIQNIEDELK